MTRTYRAEFFTRVDWAYRDVEAKTPQDGLDRAREFFADHADELKYCSYGEDHEVERVRIYDGERVLSSWESADYRLRLAGPDLVEALGQALRALNSAPKFAVPSLATDSYEIAARCERALAKARESRS
jgi:hypothetical protein